MVFEAHGMSFPCTEMLLFNYAINTVFPFYGTFNIPIYHGQNIIIFCFILFYLFILLHNMHIVID